MVKWSWEWLRATSRRIRSDDVAHHKMVKQDKLASFQVRPRDVDTEDCQVCGREKGMHCVTTKKKKRLPHMLLQGKTGTFAPYVDARGD